VRCPKHIEQYVRQVDDPSAFLAYECDEYALCYSVTCSCGCDEFRICLSAVPSVFAHCTECGNVLTIYDVRLYPAATPGSDTTDSSDRFSQGGHEVFSVYVVYEYGELDEDESFNQDDITWCEVYAFVKGTGTTVRVLSDETA